MCANNLRGVLCVAFLTMHTAEKKGIQIMLLYLRQVHGGFQHADKTDVISFDAV